MALHLLWAVDQAVFMALNGHPGGRVVGAVFGFVLRIATGGAVWLAIFALGFVGGGPRGRRIALTGALAVVLAHALGVWGLQGLVQRSDPSHVLAGVRVIAAFQPPFSFPATRVAQAFAALPYLSRSGGAGTVIFWTLAILVAIGSVYAGSAFPTDVLAGIGVGWCAARLARYLLGDPFRRQHGHLVPLPRTGA